MTSGAINESAEQRRRGRGGSIKGRGCGDGGRRRSASGEDDGGEEVAPCSFSFGYKRDPTQVTEALMIAER